MHSGKIGICCNRYEKKMKYPTDEMEEEILEGNCSVNLDAQDL
jgi:hypothetical protein